MSFNINNNKYLHILLFIIAFGILIGSGSLYRYAYNYNLIMFMIMLVMASVIFYQNFIPVNNSSGNVNLISNSYNINYSGLILLMFFIFFPIMSDVINQVKSYEITYFYIAILFLSFLLGAQSRKKILTYYLKLMVVFSFISLFYFFAELLFELPSFVPYYGVPETKLSHFYYVWSMPVQKILIVRNQSIFWEPGAFGFHLIIATALAYKTKNKLFISILIIACFTTMSTTVYIFLSLLVIYHLLGGSNKIRFVGLMILGAVIILVTIKLLFGNFEIPVYLLKVITEKFTSSSAAYASMEERTLYIVESMKLFIENIFIGAGHYATDVELKGIIGSETSALSGLLAELGLFGAICILLYIRFFKHFKIIAIPIALIWLNGEFMQYTAISLFILTHMVDEIGQNLFPAVKINGNIPRRFNAKITKYTSFE